MAVVYCAGKNSDNLREVLHIASVHALPMVVVLQCDARSGRESADTNGTKSKQELRGRNSVVPQHHSGLK